MADAADIRAWARSEGIDISARGAIPADIQRDYDRAHPFERALDHALDGIAEPDDGSMGVTEADFPPADDDPDEPGTPAEPKVTRVRAPRAERKPRPVKPPRKNFKQLFGGSGKPKSRGPRTDLSEFAEDTWRDLAMVLGGIPPVSRVLTVQAPYVGVVFDQAVKGIPLVDSVLQPVAKYSISMRALNGLIGPPVLTMAICAQGEWVTDPNGAPVFGPDGRPVPTQRTAVMLGALKYSLAQMARTADIEKVMERAAEDAERMAAVDALVDMIFGFPAATPHAPAPAPDGNGSPPAPPPGMAHPGQPGQVLVPTFVYPPPPKMDDVGAPA